MRRPILRTVLALLGVALLGVAAQGALPSDELARLGSDLTPLGGEKAGNADGTIPAWTGGITKPPAGYVAGKHWVDPFASDQIVATITKANMARFQSRLSEGHRAMLEAYDSFEMNVYPTRRSASAPQRIYDATKTAAATAELEDGGNGVRNAIGGMPDS